MRDDFFSPPPPLFLRKRLNILAQNLQSTEDISTYGKSLGTKFVGGLAKSCLLTNIFLYLCSGRNSLTLG